MSVSLFVSPHRPLLPAACADTAAFLPAASWLLIELFMLVVDDILAVAVAEAEVDGVAEVTKQLEKQAIEDKEKEEDGEEGDCLTPDITQ